MKCLKFAGRNARKILLEKFRKFIAEFSGEIGGDSDVVGEEGLEPSRSLNQRILSPQRIPFRHSPGLEAPTGIEPV